MHTPARRREPALVAAALRERRRALVGGNHAGAGAGASRGNFGEGACARLQTIAVGFESITTALRFGAVVTKTINPCAHMLRKQTMSSNAAAAPALSAKAVVAAAVHISKALTIRFVDPIVITDSGMSSRPDARR